MLVALGLAKALSSPDTYGIYARARARWTAQQYPRYLTYDVRISGTLGASTIANTYASFDDTQDNVIRVRATSAEEAADPYVPHGVAVKATVKISYSRHTQLSQPSADGDVHASRTMHVTQREQYDVLGVPLLSPAYSFGLMPAAAQAREPAAPSPAGLKTIASVTAVHRDYDIRYLGNAMAGGAACYRLQLVPRRDPGVLRLRELWIDTRDYTTREALVQGNFTAGPGPALPWLIEFTDEDGLMYIRDERAIGTVRYLGRTYADVTIAFSNVQAVPEPSLSWSLAMFRTSGDILQEPQP